NALRDGPIVGPIVQVDVALAPIAMWYREVDQSIAVEIGRGNGGRRRVREVDAPGIEPPLALVQADVLDRLVGTVCDDDVRTAILVEISHAGVPGFPFRPAVG